MKNSLARVTLTEQARAFAESYAETGDATKAAMSVGFLRPEEEAKRLLASPAVRSEVERAVRRRASLHQALALSTIIDLAQNADRDSVRLDAAKTILDRTGMPAVSAHQSVDTRSLDQLTPEELKARIEEIDRALAEAEAPAATLPPPDNKEI